MKYKNLRFFFKYKSKKEKKKICRDPVELKNFDDKNLLSMIN